MRKILNTKELLQYAKNISGKTICLDYEEQRWLPPDSISFCLKFSSIDVYDSLNIISLKSVDECQLDFHFVTNVSLRRSKLSDDLYIECFQPSHKDRITYHLMVS